MLCGIAIIFLLKGDSMNREEWEALYYTDKSKNRFLYSSTDDEYSVEHEDRFDSDCNEEFE